MIQLPSVLPENFKQFLLQLDGVVNYSDPDSEIDIRKSSTGYAITIIPKEPEFRQDIINNVLYYHRLLKIPLKFSSSLQRQRNVSFLLEIIE